jgi:phytoene synthase
MQDAFSHCERVVRDRDRDRFIADLFAPAARRGALHAIHAFATEIARVRELVTAPIAGEIRLQWWHDALTGAGHGEVRAHPIAAALLQTVERHRLPLPPLLAMIEARRFDLYDEPMQSLEQLEQYVEQTAAGPMGCAVQVLTESVPGDVPAPVRHAGIAYGLTELLRTLPWHAAHGRSYVPLEVLQRHGADPEILFAGTSTDALRAALAELRAVARRHLAAASGLSAALPASAGPALLPVALVPAWLDRMDRSRDPFQPPSLPAWRRQWIMWRAAGDPLNVKS